MLPVPFPLMVTVVTLIALPVLEFDRMDDALRICAERIKFVNECPLNHTENDVTSVLVLLFPLLLLPLLLDATLVVL